MWIIRIIVLDLLQRPGRCSKSKACGSTGALTLSDTTDVDYDVDCYNAAQTLVFSP